MTRLSHTVLRERERVVSPRHSPGRRVVCRVRQQHYLVSDPSAVAAQGMGQLVSGVGLWSSAGPGLG